MLFYAESFIFTLQPNADTNIQCLIFICKVGIISILHITSSPLLVCLNIDLTLYKVIVQIFQDKEFTCHIHHWTLLTFLGNKYHTRYTCFLCYKCIICTKGRSDMYDTRTILSGHIITWNNFECTCTWISPRNKLLVFHTNKVSAFTFP